MNCVGSSGRRPHDQSRAVAAVECRSLKLKEEQNMSCCSDVMKPVKPSVCCTHTIRRHMLHERCVIQAAAARLWLRIQTTSSWSASSPSMTYVAAWRLMTGARRTCASKRSCDLCLPVVRRASRLKKRAMSLPVADKVGDCCAPSAFTIWRNRRATDEGTAQCDTTWLFKALLRQSLQ